MKIPERDPKERGKNFKEVAIKEAKRCLQCKNPKCIIKCPVGVNIPEFIKEAAEGNFKKTYDIILKSNSLPAVCGSVCPQESQCESVCV